GPRGAPVGGASLGAPLIPFGGAQEPAPGRTAPADAAGEGAATAPPVRLGPFGAPFAAPGEATAPDDPGRAWNIVPSIAINVGATNNVFQTRDNARSDVFTNITPGILIDGATERVRATINYAPVATGYATYTSQNSFAQLGSGQILAELVPDALFLDIRGSASLSTTSGGVVPDNVLQSNRNNQVQTYLFQVSPYYVHRFGSTATAQLGYTFAYSQQEGTTQFLQPGATLPSFQNQDYISNRGYLVVRSGEDFGPLALQGRIDGTAFSGTGVYDGAHVFVTALEARYAITPTIAVLLEGGYENIEYGGTNPARISDAIWTVGVRLTPTPDSFIIARYGHRGGFDSPSLDAGIQLGGFTRLTASYVERLATSATNAQSLLDTTTLDALGNPVDAASGAPVLYANSFSPVQSGLFRTKTGSVALTQAWPRDSVTISAFYQQQDPVSAARGTQIVETTGYYGGIAWTHELTPATALNLGVQVGRTETANQPSTDVVFASAALSHRINERLTGVLRVLYSTRSSSLATNEYSQAIVLAGLRQTF
ncbi:TIGR03016 family PEP-CTERM system-associated outer membrane protein, partial [Roseomonas rosulenta]|uniref:TIGR03016 family PEP-CTERM system-associated outer membrane protein n=1 Tax=Roseomonas rosulenta TaxID=2748667 RepID=UPI0018E02B3F